MPAPHHKAWLDFHPHRSSKWLKEMLKNGFQVHHVDGNHQNNQPHNLVLIDGDDHVRLHGFFKLMDVRIDHRETGRQGGIARANLPPEKLSEINTMAARKRWQRVRERRRLTELNLGDAQ